MKMIIGGENRKRLMNGSRKWMCQVIEGSSMKGFPSREKRRNRGSDGKKENCELKRFQGTNFYLLHPLIEKDIENR